MVGRGLDGRSRDGQGIDVNDKTEDSIMPDCETQMLRIQKMKKCGKDFLQNFSHIYLMFEL